MLNLCLITAVVFAAVAAFVAFTLRQDRAMQAVRDEAFDRWIAARGHEAALHEGSATVVVIGTASLPPAGGAERALPDGSPR
jgi:hypothetical protein